MAEGTSPPSDTLPVDEWAPIMPCCLTCPKS